MKDISSLKSEDGAVAFDEDSPSATPFQQNASLNVGPSQLSFSEIATYKFQSDESSHIPFPQKPEESPQTSVTIPSVTSITPCSVSAASTLSADFMSLPLPSTPSLMCASSPLLRTPYTPSPATAYSLSPQASCPPSPVSELSTVDSSALSPTVTIKQEVIEVEPDELSPPNLSQCSDSPPSPGKTVSGNLLPPCRICHEKASGFHYGLNTCEACKGFFRRSLKRGATYVCTRDGKCNVTGERRNLCGYCRYHKCIALGMSKTAIKTGRYTHAKRTKDTLEIKRLLHTEQNVEQDMDFDSITAQVVKAHDDFIISSTKIPEDVIKHRQKLKIEQSNLKEHWFGQMNRVPSDKHQEIFDMTGLDIDNRREVMEFHVKNSERWIRGYISFAKKVPGFRELAIGDQAKLIKYARIEFWFLGSFPGYSSDLGVAVMPNGRCFTREEMYTVWRPEYIDVAFHLARRLQKLKVLPEEIVIVKTMCLTASDRCVFEEPAKVENIQWQMVRCLLYLLKKRCSTPAEVTKTFCEVINCLTELRNLNEAEFQTIQNTPLFDLFSKNPLMMEVLPY